MIELLTFILAVSVTSLTLWVGVLVWTGYVRGRLSAGKKPLWPRWLHPFTLYEWAWRRGGK